MYVCIHTHTHTHTHIFCPDSFLSITDYYKILNIVPCAIQSLLFIFYIVHVSINPKPLIYRYHPFPYSSHKFVVYLYESVSVS